MPQVASRERRQCVIVHLCDSETEVIRSVWVHQKRDTRNCLQRYTFSLHVAYALGGNRDRPPHGARGLLLDEKEPAIVAFDNPSRVMLPFSRKEVDHLGRHEVVVHIDCVHGVSGSFRYAFDAERANVLTK
jgi:hypothetical protein